MSNRDEILNDSETAIRTALNGKQAEMWTAFPAIVTSVNHGAMTLECTCAIQGLVTDADGGTSYVNLPPLVDVPICFPSAGGFILWLPVKVNDEILVVISSRCIDAWWQSGGIQKPAEFRMHDLSDGFAIPGPRSQPNVVASLPANNARLMTVDGNTYLEITPNGAINMKAASGITVMGDLSVTGEVIAKSGATPIPLSAHMHPGVTPGGGNTGAPIP